MSYAGSAAPTPPGPGGGPDVISITIGKQTLSGWQTARITRGIERCPSDFMLRLTELYLNSPVKISIAPGDPCSIKFGNDTILTGYVNRYASTISASAHEITVSGRSRVQDMVDCSAKFPTMQANNTTIVGLAKILAKPFGISVVAPDGDSAVIPTFNVTLTETPYEILEQIARWAQFLVYDDTDGNLVIATVGDTHMASGFVQGTNVQEGSVSFSNDDRYTEIDPVFTSTTFLLDNTVPPVGSSQPVVPAIPYIPGTAAFDKSFPARADGQPRYRPLIVVSPQTQNSQPLAAQYAAWLMARQFGRSQQIRIKTDIWRDSAGTLWQPNALASISIPVLKMVNQTWLISEVTFNRDEAGTTADVVLMPPSAFVPQKEILVPYDWRVGSIPNTGATGDGPKPN